MARLTLRGRAAEMSTVLGTFRRTARVPRSTIVALVGEPGIGKTSLLRDAAEQARRQGFAVGLGKTEEVDQVAPGAPLLEALRSGARPLLDAATFAGLIPLYERPLWLVDRIAGLLSDAADRQPLLVGVDDVQWTDPLTRLALRLLPSRLTGSPIVWLLTSRLASIERLESIIAATGPAVPVTRIDLGPLTGAAIDELAADHLGAPPDAATRHLLGGVGGNPFWAVQALTGLARRRAHDRPETAVRAELMAGLRQRLDALPEPAVALVRAVAVCGRTVSADAVAEMLESTPELMYEAAVQAREEGLLTVDADGLGLPHDLIRQALYAHIPPGERARLHRARGRQLVTALAAVPHFLASARPGDLEAVDVTLRAAADSVTPMPEQAGTLARQALTLLPAGHPRTLEFGERALAILVDAQRNNDVLDLADALLPLAATPAAAAAIEVAAGRALWETGAGPELERRAASALARADLPPAARSRLSALRALGSTRTSSAPESVPAAEAVLAEGTRLGDPLTQRIALLALTEAARNVGEHHTVLGHFDRLRLIAPGTHVAERIRVLQHLDRYDEAAILLAKARREAGDTVERLLPSYLFAQVWQHHNLGEITAAETIARALLRQAEAIDNFAYALNARIILCGLAIYRGELDRAREAVAPIAGGAERLDLIRSSRLIATQAWLAAEEGDPQRSMRIIGPLLADADNGCYSWIWSPGWTRTFAGAAKAAGDTRAARRVVRLADLGARRSPGVATTAGLALQVRGHLADDTGLLHRAVSALRGSPRRILLANALGDLGDALVAAGRPDDGHAALREARDLYEQTGAHGYARATEDRHPAIGERRRGPATRGWAALTEGEARVAELIVAGHSNRSAASLLGISANTVGTHLRSIFAKFDVRSRVQLANAVRAE